MSESVKKYDTFISYRRDGGWSLGRYLYERLSRDGYKVFFDVESMRSGKFNEQIYESIDDSASMVVVLPPRGLDRCVDEGDWVRKEVAYAISRGKTLIPVMMQGFSFPKTLPDDIAELPSFQGVRADSNVSADYWYENLKKYIDQQLDEPSRLHDPAPTPDQNENASIRSNFVASASFFTGREGETGTIHDRLDAGAHYLFVHGCGGIGKSELAKHYAQMYRDRYSVVLFLRYKNSLREMLLEVPVDHFRGTDEQRLEKLKGLFCSGMLVIIDNYDVPVEQETELIWLLQSGADLLITTRTNFAGIVDNTHILDLDSLPPDVLRTVFEHYSGITIIGSEDEKLFGEICRRVEYHTYAVELLARHTAFSGLTLREAADGLKAGIMQYSREDKVLTAKDDMVSRQSVPDLIRVLFRLSSLSEEQKQVLRNLSLLDYMVMTKRIYRGALNAQPSEMEALNELIERGIIRTRMAEKEEVLEMHPLIEETVRAELEPALGNCPAVYDFIRWKYVAYDWPEDVDGLHDPFSDAAEKYEFVRHAQFLLRFFANVDLCDDAALGLFCLWIRERLANPFIGTPENRYWDARLWQVPEASNSYRKEYQAISFALRGRTEKTEDLFDAQLAILHAWLRMGKAYFLYNVEEEEKIREEGTRQAFEDCFSTAAILAEKTSEIRLPASVFQAVLIAERSGSCRGLCEEIYRVCNEYISRNMSAEDMDCYDIPYDEDGRPMIGQWDKVREKRFADDYGGNDDSGMDEKKAGIHARYIAPFVNNPEKRIQVIREIMEDPELSLCEKLETIESCLEEISVFSEWLQWHRVNFYEELKGKDHTAYTDVADYCNKLLNSNRDRLKAEPECNKPYLGIKFTYFKNRILIACIEEDKEKVREILGEFLDIFKRNYDRYYLHKDSETWEEDGKPFRMIPYGNAFIEVMRMTSRIGKAAWTVMERIEALELERRIPEQLSPDLQEEIDRILADEFYDVIDHVNHAMACVTDDSDSWLTREEADKAVEYRRMLHARLEEIIDSGYKMRKEKD